jgi:sodium transport system permease protein
MLRDAIIIFRKEAKNLIKDRRTLAMVLLLPLVLMPAIFGTIAVVSERRAKDAAESLYDLVIVNNPDMELRSALSKHLRFREYEEGREGALQVVFPPGYAPGDEAEVTLFFDSTSSKSSYAANQIQTALGEYERNLADQRLRQSGISLEQLMTLELRRVDTAPEEAQGAGFLAVMLPYILLIYVFAGSMNIGLDTTAGEKERGSLASILVNQVSRTSIAVGKIMYVVAAGLLHSLSSSAGILIAVALVGAPGAPAASAGLGILSFGRVIGLLLTLVSLSGLAASIIILLGSYAKSVKEGGGYILPIYLLVVITGVATMQMDPTARLELFFIPVVNGVFAVKEILLGQVSALHMAIVVVVNLLVTIVMALLVSRLFNSERILKTV